MSWLIRRNGRARVVDPWQDARVRHGEGGGGGGGGTGDGGDPESAGLGGTGMSGSGGSGRGPGFGGGEQAAAGIPGSGQDVTLGSQAEQGVIGAEPTTGGHGMMSFAGPKHAASSMRTTDQIANSAIAAGINLAIGLANPTIGFANTAAGVRGTTLGHAAVGAVAGARGNTSPFSADRGQYGGRVSGPSGPAASSGGGAASGPANGGTSIGGSATPGGLGDGPPGAPPTMAVPPQHVIALARAITANDPVQVGLALSGESLAMAGPALQDLQQRVRVAQQALRLNRTRAGGRRGG